jgi:hypothetical protein
MIKSYHQGFMPRSDNPVATDFFSAIAHSVSLSRPLEDTVVENEERVATA